MTRGDVAPEISTRVVSVFFLYFEHVFGRPRMLEAFAAIEGALTLEYLLDPENFVSLEYCTRVARVLTERSADPEFLRKAGEFQFSNPKMFGFAFYLMRSLGSPALYYRLAVKAAASYNRVCDMRIEALTDRSLRLSYRSLRPEGTRLMCQGRLGQLAAAPTLWGLPPAVSRELECQNDGAEACRYEFQWEPGTRPVWRALAAGGVGAALGALARGVAGAACGLVVGALGALALGYRAQARAASRRIADSAEGTTVSMMELQRRFIEVQRLHEEAAAANRTLAEEMHRRAQAEAALREAQKLEAVGRLSGGIAHDFNNILTVILGGAASAREAAGDPAELTASLDSIAAAALRASGLTKQLLAFARRQVVEPRIVDVGAHVRLLDSMLRALVGEDVRLEIARAGDGETVLVDPTQLEQVVINLAVNARDAMPTGGTLRFDTRVVAARDPTLPAELKSGAYVCLEVTDSGHGMDEATRTRVFEPFFTTKEAGRGTGLGLATCHGIVSQAGGAITVRTALGAGTTFGVFLPRVEGRPALEGGSPAVGVRGGTETVLVVEDDADVRQVVVRALSSAGYRVLAAAGAREALALAEAGEASLDLLVTDVVMEGLDGRALATRLGAARPSLRVLFVSGYPHDVLSSHGVLDGGINLLHKPFSGEDLLVRVRAVLDERRHDDGDAARTDARVKAF